jgi:hypothetical protein
VFIICGRNKGKKAFGRPRCGWEDTIEVGIKGVSP